MAVLEKIRVKFGILITVLVAVALLSFIIDPTTLQNAAQMFSSDNKVGEMNGKSISYRDFYGEYDKYSKLYEMMGQKVNDERSQSAIRDVAWQSIFDEEVFYPKAAQAGIFVGGEELKDLSQGDEISPVLAQQRMFCDENGAFDRNALLQFVQNVDSDASGQSAAYWDFLETSVYKQKMYQKYTDLLVASTLQNKLEKERVIADNNVTLDVDYIAVPVGFAPDSTITVSSSELKAYYNERKAKLQQPANRDIEYVMWEVEPSQEDKDAVKETFDSVYEEFKTADNLKNFVALNSDAKWDSKYYSKEELESEPEFQAIFASNAVSAVRTEENSFSAARVADRAKMANTAKLSYAAFALTDEAKADELLAKANKAGKSGEEFTPMQDNQGNLVEVTQDILAANGISDFSPIFSTPKGKAVKVRSLNLQAFYVLFCEDRGEVVEKVQLARLVKNVLPSEDTYRDYLMKATAVADKAAGKLDKFNECVKEEDLPVIPMNGVYESTRRVGVCENARELVRWVFDKKTKKGSVSDVIVVDNKYYFVAAVTETRKEGQVALKDVEDQMKRTIMMEKKIEKLKGEVAEKIKDCKTVEEAAAALNESISHKTGVSFGSQYQQLDNEFLGALANASEGVLCGPCKGQYGVVVFQVANKNVGSFFTDADAATYQAQKSAYQVQVLDGVLAEEADIKDYRPRFF